MGRPAKISKQLRQRIREVFAIRRSLPRDQDLAAEAGVSVSAIRQVFNQMIAEEENRAFLLSHQTVSRETGSGKMPVHDRPDEAVAG